MSEIPTPDESWAFETRAVRAGIPDKCYNLRKTKKKKANGTMVTIAK